MTEISACFPFQFNGLSTCVSVPLGVDGVVFTQDPTHYDL